MRKTIGTFLMALTLTALPSFAQGPGGPPPGAPGETGPRTPPDPATMIQHRLDRLTTVLSLTPDQQSQIKTIFTNAATTATTLMPQMQTVRQNLQTAVTNGDSAGITQAANTIGTLTAQLTAAKGQADAAFLKVLTPDQRDKFNQMKGSRRGPGGRGPGGFGPGGMPGGPRGR
jgi:Spy/CpxP family protein refolding chaperone